MTSTNYTERRYGDVPQHRVAHPAMSESNSGLLASEKLRESGGNVHAESGSINGDGTCDDMVSDSMRSILCVRDGELELPNAAAWHHQDSCANVMETSSMTHAGSEGVESELPAATAWPSGCAEDDLLRCLASGSPPKVHGLLASRKTCAVVHRRSLAVWCLGGAKVVVVWEGNLCSRGTP
jgi:hypothetical protein